MHTQMYIIRIHIHTVVYMYMKWKFIELDLQMPVSIYTQSPQIARLHQKTSNAYRYLMTSAPQQTSTYIHTHLIHKFTSRFF